MTLTDRYPVLFGRYALIDLLARGGMGELHLAVSGDAGIQKLCVIKQILAHIADEEHVQRFVDEANVMVQLSHGNLVPVLESGAVDGRYFMAMEYVEGRNLREVWNALSAQEQPWPLSLSLYIAKELCRGLAYAHAYGGLGLVHRDVSPPNVLLSYSGEVRLTDFGLALSAIKVQKTLPGILLGKLPYMSPEQARGEALDARSDLYSAGVILWELVTGRRRLDQRASQSLQLRQAMSPTFVAPTALIPALPPALDAITRRALAERREDRYPDAESMRSDLATLLAQLDPTTDASSMERFLAGLYGPSIEDERRRRRELLEGMAPEIERLIKERPAAAPASTSAETETAGETTGEQATELVTGGTLDGKYLIHALIGEGGMGKVYRATHLGIDRVVALKILLPEYQQIPAVVERFQMEARAASRIGHPNVVEIYDSGTTKGGLLYFAMELLEGTDLADLLHAEKQLEVNQVVRIAIQICEAMSAAHDAGVIHRDLKPENIYLVVREGQPDFVKVVDFGISRMAGVKGQTLPGLTVGTPEYMAPEQADTKPYDHRVDIYAVGVLLYEMLSGRVPHPGAGLSEVQIQRYTEPVASLCEQRGDVPERLEELIFSALAVDPMKRPQTMAQLAYELRKVLEGRAAAVASILNISGAAPSLPAPEPPLDEPAPLFVTTEQLPAYSRPASRRQRFLLGGMVGLALALAILAVVLLLGDRGSEENGVGAPAVGALRERPRAEPASAPASAPASQPAETADGDGLLGEAGPKTDRTARPRRRPRKKPAPVRRLEGTLNPFKK